MVHIETSDISKTVLYSELKADICSTFIRSKLNFNLNLEVRSCTLGRIKIKLPNQNQPTARLSEPSALIMLQATGATRGVCWRSGCTGWYGRLIHTHKDNFPLKERERELGRKHMNAVPGATGWVSSKSMLQNNIYALGDRVCITMSKCKPVSSPFNVQQPLRHEFSNLAFHDVRSFKTLTSLWDFLTLSLCSVDMKYKSICPQGKMREGMQGKMQNK